MEYVVNEEFHTLAGKFFVKDHELGKFWEAYKHGKDKGYSGNRLDGYVGLSIKNHRRDNFKRSMKDLNNLDCMDKWESHLTDWDKCGSSVTITNGDSGSCEKEEIGIFIENDDSISLNTVRRIMLRERIQIFKKVYSNRVGILEKWLGGEELKLKEYRILVESFNSLNE